MANDMNTEPTYTAENLTDDDIRRACDAGLITHEDAVAAISCGDPANDGDEARRAVARVLNAAPAGARVKTPAGWEP